MQDRPGATPRSATGEPVAAHPARWVLVALSNGDLRTYPLVAGGDVVLGRDLDCDIVLDHHRVSRRHARLRLASAGDVLSIQDLGSRNGTRVGEALEPNQPCPVRPGDPIGIGPFTLTAMRAAPQPPSSLAIEEPTERALPPALLPLARGAANVLVRCEPGGARRVVAEALHCLSGRGGRFVAIDCAAAVPDRLEGELFDALAAAGEGTALLDAIDALPLPLQVKLRQAIEHREARGGSGEPIAVLARLVCATRRDLLADVEAGAFRLDLYYRIAGATLRVRPPGSPPTLRRPRSRK